MLGRLSFLGRVVLIVLALFFALAALGLVLRITARDRQDAGAERFPIPAQAAAIVELIDATPAADRARVLKAVTSDMFHVRIVDAPEGGLLKGIRMPGVEWLVGQYLETMTDREVLAFRRAPESARPVVRLFARLAGERRSPIAIAAALSDGRYAVFEIRGDAGRRVFGIPVGLGIGLFGGLFAAIAMWAIAREARPLRELAQSLAGFAGDGVPREIQPRGAPEIRRLITTTNDMQGRISGLIKGRTMLLGAISHDLKTYITRLRLRAETIKDEDQRTRAERDLDDMTALIDEALSVARGTTVSDRRVRIDLRDLVIDEVARRQEQAIQFVHGTKAETPVRGDPVALRRVIGNLLDNAGRYGKQCRVALRRMDDMIVATIEDDGPGIPEAERAAVLEPFYRLEKSRSRSTGGSGLGLAIARQIAEAHGGTIVLGTSSLGGLRADLQLPVG
jgi:two-component system, OmpR family, osmolarity sensor histidine kinase EnvZ